MVDQPLRHRRIQRCGGCASGDFIVARHSRQNRQHRCNINNILSRQQGQTVDEIAQFTHIATPGLGFQHFNRFTGQYPARQALGCGQHEEMLGQCLDVIRPLAQGRQVDRHDIDAIIQILAELAGSDHRREVAVGGSNDPRVNPHLVAPAHPADQARLQRAQQPSLRLHRHVANFIEKQRATRRLLEFADMPGNRPGKGALFMAEQFAFNQVRRNGGGVDRDKRPGLAVAQLVDGLGHQFLAGARFAQYQHGQIIAQNPGNHAIDRLHRLAAAH